MMNKPETCIGCPLYEKPHGKPTGYVPSSGTGENGVLIVLEAAGEWEEKEGIPVVGKAGMALFQQLSRIGISRDGFLIHNVLSCRPPDNKFDRPYIPVAIKHCAPNLDGTIARLRDAALANGKTPVIVTLGVPAFKRVMGFDDKHPMFKKDYIAYPHWHDRYKVWVLAADHPAYLVRGFTHLWPVVQFVFKRALEIADGGFQYDKESYLLDPQAGVFSKWVDDYLRDLSPMSYDIETPYKARKTEEDLSKEEPADHTITRISFCYKPGQAVSIKWSAEYLADIERIFKHAPVVLGWNSDGYDYPRVSRYVRIHGRSVDGMVAWHILNTALPKGLGFVTPFYVQNTAMWKHLDDTEPAFYNAKDADMALRNYLGIERDLKANDLWHVFADHVLKLNQALVYMSGKGVLRDDVMRAEAEQKLTAQLIDIEARMEQAVPPEARKFKVAKKQPKDLTGWTETTQDYPENFCETCGISLKRKWKKHSTLCGGPSTSLLTPLVVWQKPLPFKVSKLGMTSYQKALKHQAIVNRKENKVTFNEDAIVRLMKDYPKDPLYPNIIEHRKTQKLLSTYIGVTNEFGRITGGMPTGKDGRIHTTYTHNPSTLRFASEEPNLQNLPRPQGPDDPATIIRNLVVAGDGNTFYARDYSGIEAVLTGYFALDPRYIRLAKRDVHTYYTVYALYELEGGARIKGSDLPSLDWPDDRLFPYLEQLKKEFKKDRNNLYKHLVHAANFMQSPRGAQAKIFSETRVEYPLKTVAKVMDIYYTLFPKIRQWHWNVLEEAEKDGFLRNPWGYVHRFNRVFDYKWDCGKWNKRPGADSNKAIAFKPQSTAAGIIKEALMRLFFERFDEAGQYLRLQVHDELFFECPLDYVDKLDAIVTEEMERPVRVLTLPESYDMGTHLSVLTESKQGPRWGSMK